MTGFLRTVESQVLMLKLLDPATRVDPYPLYARFRDRGPFRLPEANLAIFSAYRDCDEVLRHPSASSNPFKSAAAQRQGGVDPTSSSVDPPGYLFLDPPEHTRLRKLVGKAFVPKVVNALQPDITALVDGLLEQIAQNGRFDVIADFAYPVPVALICRLLGVPPEDEPQFSQASSVLVEQLDPFVPVTGESPAAIEKRQQEAGRWLREYLHGLIEMRRSQPGDDLLSRLITVEDSGDRLTRDEIVSTCCLLLIAGHETTVSLIANAMLAMLRHPSQWAALGADASRAPAIIEETLRYDPPLHLMGRIAAGDMAIGDAHVVKGDTMLLLVAAAQRDPAEYERPDIFEPDRGSFQHLAFGRGLHYCVGAPLARLEAGIALSAVTARFPNARLDGEPQYKPNVMMRGLSTLAVAV